MKPEMVRSPKKWVHDVHVIYTDDTEGWSVAELQWLHQEDNQLRPRVGLRWDGLEHEIGNPQSSGHSTWFLLPEGAISEMVLAHAQKLAGTP